MLLQRYIEYIGLYMGIALVGGAIVHMPGAPVKNIVLMLIGMAMFLTASVREARSRSGSVGTGAPHTIAVYLALSAFLSVGLGMISGSIQHFDDFPHYCSILIPFGLGVSLLAFGWREALLPRGLRLAALALAMLILLPLLWLGLDAFGDHAFAEGHTH